MKEEKYVAALEISSSKIIGAVGLYSGDGQLTVIAVEQEESKECVKYGIVQNPEETAMRVSRIIDKLQRNPAVAPRVINSVYVGLSGLSMRSVTTTVRLSLPEESEITDDVLRRLRDDAQRTAIDNTLEVVDVVPRSYVVDKTETTSPKGSIGSSISATFDIIVCRTDLKRNIQRTLDRAKVGVAGYIIAPLAAGHLILPGEEKRLGCMLVDIGAETTSVSLYRKGSLFYFATLPLGGRNITRDITSLGVLEERAEEIKVTTGRAIAPEKASTLNFNGVKQSDISNMVVARSEEIVANIVQRIYDVQLKEKDLSAGIICIGGGSRLTGMMELLGNHTGMRVRMGNLPDYIHTNDPKAGRQEAVEVISILYSGATFGDEECLGSPKTEELPVNGTAEPDERTEERHPRKTGNNKAGRLIGSIRSGFSKLFSSPDEDDESDLL